MSFCSLLDNPDEINNIISNQLEPKEKEKKKHGEVFTPMTLVSEMLDKLPNEVWTNKNLKWLDSSAGIGNFPIAVYFRLMERLEIENFQDRRRHILENMLYMSELEENNVKILKEIFDINNEYSLNILQCNSLETDYENIFNVKKFDIIIGNPPYQKENKKTNSAKGGQGNNLYLDFVEHSLSLLKEEGYLVFIHPQNWRKISSNKNIILEKFLNKNIYYLKLNYGGNFFKNVSVKTDYYVLKNSKNKNFISTVESFIDNKIETSKMILSKKLKFIPNIFNKNIASILEKVSKYGKVHECIINCTCHKNNKNIVTNIKDKTKNELKEFKYPLYNTSGNPYNYKSKKEHPDQKSKKVILSNSGKLNPFFDNGIYGTTQDSMYILVDSKKEGELIVNILNSKLFKFLIEICKWGNFRNEKLLFSYFKYPDYKNISEKIDNMDTFINKFYKLTKDEINYINNLKNLDNKNSKKLKVSVDI